ncbi:hypothetical protein D5S17_14250 [Pseudonocardiaceae bacterium YIM PH 21723]|nr:hypothetical protein D5S17_14250 [Pseudonocardiaceae bacterium YIM PH 21723]
MRNRLPAVPTLLAALLTFLGAVLAGPSAAGASPSGFTPASSHVLHGEPPTSPREQHSQVATSGHKGITAGSGDLLSLPPGTSWRTRLIPLSTVSPVTECLWLALPVLPIGGRAPPRSVDISPSLNIH